MARIVGAPESSIALTRHTTEGVNIAVWGVDLGPDDEVVTTTVEHEGVVVPLAQFHHRRCTRIRFADVGDGSGTRDRRRRRRGDLGEDQARRPLPRRLLDGRPPSRPGHHRCCP